MRAAKCVGEEHSGKHRIGMARWDRGHRPDGKPSSNVHDGWTLTHSRAVHPLCSETECCSLYDFL